MCKLIALAVTLYYVLVGTTDCTSSFDQRQTGDLNVQIGLKNIKIIALLKGGKEEYVDYDYAYDYSEMTIKPPNGTTSNPLNATNPSVNTAPMYNATFSTTAAATALLEQTIEPIMKNNTFIQETTVLLDQTANNYVVTTTQTAPDVPTATTPDSLNVTNISTIPITTKCRRGFVQNNEGKCEYKVHGTSNALRRIVKLAQKIKIGREYGGS